MSTPHPAPAAFLVAYDADPMLRGFDEVQMRALLGEPAYRGAKWELRDEEGKRTFEVSASRSLRTAAAPDSSCDAWRVGCCHDDVPLETVVGPATGVGYELVHHTSAWCGTVTEAILWRSTTAKGTRLGVSLDAVRGLDLDGVRALLGRVDRIIAAEGGSGCPPLSRADYEAACARFGVTPRPDEGVDGVDSYAVRYGDFSSATEAGTLASIDQRLAWRRRAAVEDEAKALPVVEQPPAAPRRWGAAGVRYDEACGRCRKARTIDNDTDLCESCST